MVSAERLEEFNWLREAVREWASSEGAVVAVALVGSWARGDARMESDADVVVLTTSDDYVRRQHWVGALCGHSAILVRTVDWGGLTERRVRMGSGFEIEFGFAAPSWAVVDPVDRGTLRVVSDGCVAWYDPADLIGGLLRTVAD